MKTYLTGTTLECLTQIIKDGFIATTPPHRVWRDYSEDYVYFVPSQNEQEDRDVLLSYAFEQADFAVYQLDHTKRVILEIEGINEDLLEDDPDSAGIYAVKYPQNVPISCIKNIYIDQEDNSMDIKEFIAITFLYRDENRKYINKAYDLYTYGDYDPQYVWDNIPIKHIDCIQIETLLDEGELENTYHELHESLDYSPEYFEYSLNEFIQLEMPYAA